METLHSQTGNSSTYYSSNTGNTYTAARSSSTPALQKKVQKPTGSSPVTSTDNFILNTLPSRLFDVLRPHLRRVFVAKEQFLFQQDDALEYV